ncbi:MAG: nitrate reductase molybdenum cofactor assembly chaperone [Desulfuromonadaceae bacterium]|nr:nitrate reductase molybdenum cofactor assembly chaperone [Desulfuromonadaceae bacterium]
MTIAESYDALARMMDYPSEKTGIQSDCDVVGGFMKKRGLDNHILSSFADFATTSPLAELQEEYVATFDFNPATAPYLGHHLFGDNQKKGGYMIMLKQEFERCGYAPCPAELPDHLSVVLGFLAHQAGKDRDRDRKKFIAECVLPGVERLNTAFAARRDSHWKALVETAQLLCTADCKEVQ